jgi:molybdate transport system regulatory protein
MIKNAKPANAPALQIRLRITAGEKIALGPGKIELLGLLEETGSISEAARRMNMSYMKAWSLIQTMNACFKEPVIEAVRGGHQRGGAELTATGHRVLKLYQQMETGGLKADQADWRALQKLLQPK